MGMVPLALDKFWTPRGMSIGGGLVSGGSRVEKVLKRKLNCERCIGTLFTPRYLKTYNKKWSHIPGILNPMLITQTPLPGAKKVYG